MEVSVFVEAFGEEVVGKFALEVDPSIMGKVVEIVFDYKFTRDVVEFDPHVFRAVEWSTEIEVFKIEACKFCCWARKYAVEQDLDEF